MDIQEIIDELESQKKFHELDGVEITEEDVEVVRLRMQDGMDLQDAVDEVLEGIKYCLSQGW